MVTEDEGGRRENEDAESEDPVVVDLRDGVDTVAAYEADADRRAASARRRAADRASGTAERP